METIPHGNLVRLLKPEQRLSIAMRRISPEFPRQFCLGRPGRRAGACRLSFLRGREFSRYHTDDFRTLF